MKDLKCHFLHLLPPELRLHIYEYLFEEPCHPSLLIRSDSRIEVITFGKAHAALLKTCRAIYAEASPVLYNNTTFRVQIYPVEGYPSCGNGGHLSRNTLYLRRVRHLQIKACVLFPKETRLAKYLLRTLAGALDAAGADVKTLQLTSSLYSKAAAGQTFADSVVSKRGLVDRMIAGMDVEL